MFRFKEYLKSFSLTSFRIFVIGAIAGSVLLADYLLKRDVAGKVFDAWNEACIEQFSVLQCLDQLEKYHDKCFDSSYTSMMLKFGQSRWESFRLAEYEACMETGNEVPYEPNSLTVQ